MCTILKHLSKEGQVIISTHSHIFVDQADATYLLVKENGETKVKMPESDEDKKFLKEILDELGIAPSDLYLTNGIIFVEGISDVEILKTFANAIFQNWDAYNIAIISIGGSNIKHQRPDVLLKVNPNIAVILDSDVKSETSDLPEEKKELKDVFEKAGIKVYFWKTNDGRYLKSIENLFTKDAIEEKFGIKLDGEIKPHDDVPLIIGKKLAEKHPKYKEKIIKWKYAKHYERIEKLEKIVKELSENASKTELVKELESILDEYRKSVEKSIFKEYYDKVKHGKKLAEIMVNNL